MIFKTVSYQLLLHELRSSIQMANNNNFKSEILICRVSRKVFEWSLVWPAEGMELKPGKKYVFKITMYFIITGFLSLLMAAGLFFILRDHEYLDVEDIAAVVASYGIYYMVFFYIKKQHGIALILNELSNFKHFGKPPDFDKLDQRLNLGAKILTIFEFATATAYKTMKIIKKSECKKINAKFDSKGYHCGLGVPSWTTSDVDFFPVFHLLILYEFIFVFLHNKMCSQISFHVLEITSHAFLRIEHLKTLILECFDSENRSLFTRNLKTCVAYHSEILSLTSKIDTTFSSIMFGHFILTGAVCACIEKQIIDGHNALTGFCHFMMWIAALFVVCLGGQLVIDATESVSYALWTSKWYKADIRLQKSLLIMLMRSQKSTNITAGPFGILCYPFFVSVLKTSYSILCVLTS